LAKNPCFRQLTGTPVQIESLPTLATNMFQFNLSQPNAGWVQATFSDNNEELTVSGSYTPLDVIRNFIDTVASLKTVASGHCCWFQEPGEMHWQFLRSKDRVVVEVIRFAGVLMPRRHGPDGVSEFRTETQWLEFARQVLGSTLKIRDSLSVHGYSREWRHPFPREACEKLDKAIREATNDEIRRCIMKERPASEE
jgi:hypothetical protein